MDPDGVWPDKPKPPGRPPRKPRKPPAPESEGPIYAPKPVFQRTDIGLLDKIRLTFGFRRRVVEVERYRDSDVVPKFVIVDDDPDVLTRIRPYVRAVALFALVALMVTWGYGRLVRQATPIEAATEVDPLMRALDALAAGDMAGARRYRGLAVERDRRCAALNYLDGEMAAALKGDAAAAMVALERSPGKRSVAQSLSLAGFRSQNQDLLGSIRALREAMAAAPRDPYIRFFYASSLLRDAQYREAIVQADEYERLGGVVPVACELRAQAYASLGALAMARREYEAALGYPNAPASAHLGLSHVFARLGYDEEAEEQIRRAIAAAPKDAESYVALGIMSSKRGMVQAAEDAYRKATELDPKSVRAANNLAFILAERRGLAAEALPYAERAYKLGPEEPPVLDTLGRCYQRLGRLSEALPLLRKAARLAPDDNDIQLHLALGLAEAGRAAEARPILTQIATALDDSPARVAAREKLKAMP